MARASRSKNKKKQAKKPAPSKDQRDKQALKSLAEKRRSFEPLLREVVTGVLAAHGPDPSAQGDRSWIEVGAGLGQLRSLLPTELLSSLTHTELSESLVRGFSARHPSAKVLAADVTHLPFEPESMDAVLGLCVFDSFPEPEAACREIARVLRPGGRFVHFLDASTNIEPILSEMVGDGLLPLPNFVVDAALVDASVLEMGSLTEFLGPYQDLLVVPAAQFEFVTKMLVQAGHPMAQMLQKYAAPFLRRPFDSLAAARAFVALTGDMRNSRPLNQALTSLVSTLRQPPYSQRIPFELSASSSLSHFQARLERSFHPDAGFAIRLKDVVYARSFQPDSTDPLRARVRRVGMVHNSLAWPAPIGTSVQELNGGPSQPIPEGAAPASHLLREAAVHCFVAEKMG